MAGFSAWSTGYGDSPYQCFSAFAGNPLLVSPEKLKEDGFLSEEDIKNPPQSAPKKIDYGQAIDYKKSILKKAFYNFKNNPRGLDKDFEKFRETHKDWIDDFSLFMACKEHHGGTVWSSWEKGLVHRDKKVLAEWTTKLSDEIKYQKFVQFAFFKQWKSLKEYANEKGIKIIGDMPIFIAYDSSDLWANKNCSLLMAKAN